MHDDLCLFEASVDNPTALECVGLLMAQRIGTAIRSVESNESPKDVLFGLLDDLGALMAEVPSNRVTPNLLHAAAGRGLKEESA